MDRELMKACREALGYHAVRVVPYSQECLLCNKASESSASPIQHTPDCLISRLDREIAEAQALLREARDNLDPQTRWAVLARIDAFLAKTKKGNS